MGRGEGDRPRGRGRGRGEAGRRRRGGAVGQLAVPGPGLEPGSGVARLDARTLPQANPTDRYSGPGLGRDARGQAQPNRPAASPLATEEGKQTEKRDKTENAGRGGRTKPLGLSVALFALEKGRKGRRGESPRARRSCVKAPPSVGRGARGSPAGSGARGPGKQLHPPGARRAAPPAPRSGGARARVCAPRGRARRLGCLGPASRGPGTKGRRTRPGLARSAAVQGSAPELPGERRICAHMRIFKK